MPAFTVEFNSTVIAILAASAILLVSCILLLLTRNKDKTSGGEDVSAGLRFEERGTISTSISDDKVLNPAVFKEFNVLQVIKVSHNTKLIRFEIPFGKPLGLPIGRHVSVRADIEGSKVIRAYTPTSRPDQTGYFDLLIKSYEFGKMSKHLHSLRAGQSLEVRGPVGRFQYTKNSFERIGLVAGGTGLTPCLQVMRCILEGTDSSGDNTSFTLFFQNRHETDILLKEELDALVRKYPTRVMVYYYLSNSGSETWGVRSNEKKGYINTAAIQELMNPEKCQLVCLCGPSGFNEEMKNLLLTAGHTATSVYVW